MRSSQHRLQLLPADPAQRWAPTVRSYFATLGGLIKTLPLEGVAEAAELLVDAVNHDRQVFVLGNGGSAATASHVALDLAKGTRLKAPKRLRSVALVDSLAAMTAYSNDVDYESAIALQLENLACQDDIVIAVSASGNSANVLRAVEAAHRRACHVIALCGMGGGLLAPEADVAITVPSDDIEQVEDAHLAISHVLVRCVRHHFGSRG